MKTELELRKKFPALLANLAYIECGDGWFDIIHDLFVELNSYKYLHIRQVKEKFGDLRVYTNTIDDELLAIINKAEIKCSKTCEVCGKPGKLRSNNWLRTLCEEHKK